MISNATNLLRESRKESLFRCAGITSIIEWLVVISLWCVYKLLVTVPWVTFAYVFDAGPFRVRKYESVVLGLGTSMEVQVLVKNRKQAC